jgi:ParB family transcriptional regulator, chromosome partitioning protein
MRHDSHFVDQLGRPGGSPVGRLIPIEDVLANPNQPRQTLGDLSELAASVRQKGILEPILVRPKGGRFEIIAGERRFRAAVEAGLAEIPCIVRETSDAETMELALIENLQRKDLSPFEEADGLKALAETHGYTHEKMAEKLGKSRSSLT